MGELGIRMTQPTKAAIRVLLQDPARQVYNQELCRLAELAPGTTQPILARLEALGWLESWSEDIDPRAVGRPKRKYFRLTSRGLYQAANALERSDAKQRKLSSPRTQRYLGPLPSSAISHP